VGPPAFVLEEWQEHDIVRPLFGEVVWDASGGAMCAGTGWRGSSSARKNGKSELAAGIVLYLLVGDDEEAAEVYGAAKDTKQAGKVGEVVDADAETAAAAQRRSGQGGRLQFNKNSRRIFDERRLVLRGDHR
jgi:phage terminase large subunit-like protein